MVRKKKTRRRNRSRWLKHVCVTAIGQPCRQADSLVDSLVGRLTEQCTLCTLHKTAQPPPVNNTLDLDLRQPSIKFEILYQFHSSTESLPILQYRSRVAAATDQATLLRHIGWSLVMIPTATKLRGSDWTILQALIPVHSLEEPKSLII